MTGYPAHSWSYVVGAFRDFAAANAYFAPMRAFVQQLADSPYAASLYPQQSMHTLRLSQYREVSNEAERLSVDLEGGEFVVRYQGGPTAAVWTKRHADGMVALERLFEHLRWFTEYQDAGSRPAI
jgi:hypothetical protein